MATAVSAVVTREPGGFALEELELEDPRPDEVLVRVEAAGVCHTDLICRDQLVPVPLPTVLGHEGAGVVERVGERVTKLAPGDHVVLTFASCGACRTCQSGKPSYCLNFAPLNFGGGRMDSSTALSSGQGPVHSHFFGQSSFATFALATERNAIKVPADVPLALLGPLGCGVQTGAGAVLNTLAVRPGSSVAVFGTGSVGLSAVMAALVAGATTIVAVDLMPQRLELAQELGATAVVNAAEADAVEAVKDLTGGGADYTIETTGLPRVFRQAVDALGVLGTCGLIGAAAPGTEVSFDMGNMLLPGIAIKAVIEGDSVPEVFIPQMVELHRQGRFPIDRLVADYPMAEVARAAEDSLAGRAVKPVLRMATQ